MGQAKWRLNEAIRENAELRIKLAEWEKAWDSLLHLSAVDPLFDIAVTTYIKRYDPRSLKKETT